jgi:hypothetical protein
MQFELPGQFRGPECRVLLPVCKRLKEEFVPAFAALSKDKIKEVSPILRVGGSLGSFGEDGIENLKIRRKEAECDVVIAPRDWASISEDEIYALLRPRVMSAARALLVAGGVTEIPSFLST